jgi:hypothetical protein
MDGRQPTTPEAARWSYANVDAGNLLSPITQWYIDAFFTNNFGFGKMNKMVPIIRGELRYLSEFCNAFKVIAANPVGRVLLYRILIEIRRQDAANKGCCEDGIKCGVNWGMLTFRDASRSIKVEYQKGEFRFGSLGNVIKCDLDMQMFGQCIRIDQGKISTVQLSVAKDIVLFHEILHWFQRLRHPVRYNQESGNYSASQYMYLSRCYWGDMRTYLVWGGKFDLRETRSILGMPNYNTPAEVDLFHSDALLPNDPGGYLAAANTAGATGYLPPECEFYEGDDLSENAYRMARHTAAHPVRMRFGHKEEMKSVNNILNQFRLAHLVARNCCNAIVTANGGPPINNWRLISGEAAEPPAPPAVPAVP